MRQLKYWFALVERQFYEFNKMLVRNKKCGLYSNKDGCEKIFICEASCLFFKNRYFDKSTFVELRKCLMETF